MYSYFHGELVEINLDHIVIDVGGIGYMIFMSAIDLDLLPMVGSDIKVYTYLYLREEQMVLYGFSNKDDIEMFKLLLGITGIGPKAAMAILSTMTSDDLRFAVLSGDAKAISKAPGVGGKTAQRVVLELKDKISLEDAFEKKSSHTLEREISAESGAKNEAVMALTALGYSSSESLKAVSHVEITADMTVEDILKEALKSMALF